MLCYRAAKERQRADAAAAEAAEKAAADLEAAREMAAAVERRAEEAAAVAVKSVGELRDYKVSRWLPDIGSALRLEQLAANDVHPFVAILSHIRKPSHRC